MPRHPAHLLGQKLARATRLPLIDGPARFVAAALWGAGLTGCRTATVCVACPRRVVAVWTAWPCPPRRRDCARALCARRFAAAGRAATAAERGGWGCGAGAATTGRAAVWAGAT